MGTQFSRTKLACALAGALALSACTDTTPIAPSATESSRIGMLAGGSTTELPSTIDALNRAAFTEAASGSFSDLSSSSVSTASIDAAGTINNGTVMLGINQRASLNVNTGPRSWGGVWAVGLRYMPTGAAATEPGCTCEGWGAADNISKEWGGENTAIGGITNLALESFVRTASTAKSVVRVGSRMRVTHEYVPSPATPNLYEVKVTIENISAAPIEALYRRVMDWDVEPTPFQERVTIKRGSAANLYRTDNNGFNSSNPFSFTSYGYLNVDFEDAGPRDHGALFDFNFGTVAPGASVVFKTYYGAAGTEADALSALGAVGAEAYSLGQTRDGFVAGTPNTFMFAFSGVGGKPIEPPATDNSAPVIVPTVTPAAGVSGWHTSPVSVTWSVTDDESPISESAGCEPASVTTDTDGTTFTCSATSAGGSASESVTIKLDRTSPTVAGSLSGTLGTHGWYRSDVAVTWTVTDATSGMASSCADAALTADGEQTFTCTATDNAGNSAAGSITAKRDATNPLVAYTGSTTYTVDQDVSISCSATDATSGIASDDCAGVSGPAYSFDLGSNTRSASATDNAGNTASASVTFTVSVTESSLCTLSTRWSGDLAGSLCTKLRNAAAAGARGNTKARSNMIRAYINEVQAQAGKKIGAAEAATLIRLAEAM